MVDLGELDLQFRALTLRFSTNHQSLAELTQIWGPSDVGSLKQKQNCSQAHSQEGNQLRHHSSPGIPRFKVLLSLENTYDLTCYLESLQFQHET